MLYLALSIAPVLLILMFIYARDKYEKEPLGLCLKISLFGAIAVLPIILVEWIISAMNFMRFSAITNAFWESFLVAGLVEETFKFLVIYIFIWKNNNFNEPFDGIVYAVFASLGFALVENILYVFQHGIGTGFLRAFTAVPAHAVFGITMGYFLGLAKFNEKQRSFYMSLSLIIPIVIHGFYDFILFSQSTVLLLLFIPYLVFIVYRSFKLMKSHSDNSPFKNNPAT